MSLCPVCETPRPPGALDCVTCGLIFEHRAVDASIVPLAELEPTRSADLQVRIEATPGLEPTRFDAGADLALVNAIPMAELETTASAAVQVAVELTPGFEPTRVTEEDLPSALPAELPCRYCQATGQKVGIFCDRCGMRLPQLSRSPLAELAHQPVERKCRACGAKNIFADRCLECGARVASEG